MIFTHTHTPPSISTSMHIRLNYRSGMNYMAQDASTHAHATELFLRGIDTDQPNANELIVCDGSLSTFAILYLSGFPESHTVEVL